jgi:hypothetical protein
MDAVPHACPIRRHFVVNSIDILNSGGHHLFALIVRETGVVMIHKAISLSLVLAAVTPSAANASVILGGLFMQTSVNSYLYDGSSFQSNTADQLNFGLAVPSVTPAVAATSVGSVSSTFSNANTNSLLAMANLSALALDVNTNASFITTPNTLSGATHFVSVGYTFYTDTTYRYTLDFTLTNTPNTSISTFLGLSNAGYLFSHRPVGNEAGGISGIIGPGTYYLQIIDQVGNEQRYSGGTGRAANAASYRFSLTAPLAVPEPATWGMIIVGFGLVGRVMRQGQPRRAGALA